MFGQSVLFFLLTAMCVSTAVEADTKAAFVQELKGCVLNGSLSQMEEFDEEAINRTLAACLERDYPALEQAAVEHLVSDIIVCGLIYVIKTYSAISSLVHDANTTIDHDCMFTLLGKLLIEVNTHKRYELSPSEGKRLNECFIPPLGQSLLNQTLVAVASGLQEERKNTYEVVGDFYKKNLKGNATGGA